MAAFDRALYFRLLATARMGRELVALEETASTNDWVIARLDQEGADGRVAVARRQMAGRGRRGRSWFFHEQGSLAFSFAARMSAAEPSPVVTLAAGVALAGAVEEVTEAAPALKYPNDLILGGRKVGGILTELRRTGADGWAVTGIGVNVNVPKADFPPELEGRAGSILSALDAPAHKEAILAVFFNHMEPLLDTLDKHGPRPIVERFREYAAPFEGKPVMVSTGSEPVRGVARGMDDSGALLVETAAGLVSVISGEATFRMEG